MSKKRDPQEILPLHPLEFRILLVLLEGPSYGTRIVQEIEKREDRGPKLYPANLYRRIRDLLARGLLEVSPAPEGSDPRRTYVRLTRLGRHVARAEADRLRRLLRDAEAYETLLPRS